MNLKKMQFKMKFDPITTTALFMIALNIVYYSLKIIFDLINKRATIIDFYLFLIIMWMILFNKIFYLYNSRFDENKKLLSIVKKLFNAFFVIREANKRNITLSDLERGGMFTDIMKEIEDIIGKQKKPEVSFMNTTDKKSN